MNDALLFVSRRFGLLPEALGTGVVINAVKSRMKETGFTEVSDYLCLADSDDDERLCLRDLLLVPETWFFRDTAPFSFFSKWAARRRSEQKKPLRVLCAACATGEEAYSAAACLFGRGFTANDFTVDAMDPSERFLARARAGIFGKASLREKGATFAPDLFTQEQGGVLISERLRKSVRFFSGDVLRLSDVMKNAPYDAVFFRNALIYFTPEAQIRATRNVDAAIAPGGLLILGFAEPPSVFFPGYAPVTLSRSFSAIKPGAGVLKHFSPKGENKAMPARAEARPVGAAKREFLRDSGPRRAVQENSHPVAARGGNNEAPLSVASKLADQGDLPAAWKIVREICEKDPGNAEACFLAAQVALGLDSDDQAETLLRRTLFISPGHVCALGVFRALLLSQGRVKEAHLLGKRISRAGSLAGTDHQESKP